MLPALESVVVPAVVVSVPAPVSWAETVPPMELTAAVSAPFWIVPVCSATALIVCAVPPRSSTPPAPTVVCEAALNIPPLATVSVLAVTEVAPV